MLDSMGIDAPANAVLLHLILEAELLDLYSQQVVYLEVVRDRLRDMERLTTIAEGPELNELLLKHLNN